VSDRCLVCGDYALHLAGATLPGLFIQERLRGGAELLLLEPPRVPDALCVGCWRWAMLWSVGQGPAADGFVAPRSENPF